MIKHQLFVLLWTKLRLKEHCALKFKQTSNVWWILDVTVEFVIELDYHWEVSVLRITLVQEKVEEKPVEEKKELDEYGEGVQKRISKLTKKWREAERQKEAALDYAKGVQVESSKIKTRLSKLEPSYVTAIENRVTSGLQAAQAKLVRAREAGDINAEVDAQKDIARLGVEESKVAALKAKQEEMKKWATEKEINQTGQLGKRGARLWFNFYLLFFLETIFDNVRKLNYNLFKNKSIYRS